MLYEYSPKGVCSTHYQAEVGEDGIIESLAITNGCNGNGKGVSALVKGRHIDEVILLLDGIRCGRKQSSCPDQIAKMMAGIKLEMEE